MPFCKIFLRTVRRNILDRKSTRLNSSHLVISYAVFCLKKKNAEPGLRGEAHRRRSRVRPAEMSLVIEKRNRERAVDSRLAWMGVRLFVFFKVKAPAELSLFSNPAALPY